MGSSSAIWLVLWGIALPTSSQIEGGIDVQKFPECQCMPLNSFTLFQAEVALFKSKLLVWQEIQEIYSQNLKVYTSTSCLFLTREFKVARLPHFYVSTIHNDPAHLLFCSPTRSFGPCQNLIDVSLPESIL